MARASIIDDIINSRLYKNVIGDVKNTIGGVMDNRGVRFAAESIAGETSAEAISAKISAVGPGWYTGLDADAFKGNIASSLSKQSFMDANGKIDKSKFLTNLKKGIGQENLSQIDTKSQEFKDWADEALKAYKDTYDDIVNVQKTGIFASRPEFDLNAQTGLKKYEALTRSYFSADAGKEVHHDRVATAIGGYAAANIGGRLLTGGSLTRNSSGQRDIAGIPFI